MLSNEVKVKPVMASTSPRTNMVSRNGESMAVQATLPMLLAFWKIGNARRPAVEHRGAQFFTSQIGGRFDA